MGSSKTSDAKSIDVNHVVVVVVVIVVVVLTLPHRCNALRGQRTGSETVERKITSAGKTNQTEENTHNN